MLTVLSFVYNNLAVSSAASYHYDNDGGADQCNLRARRSAALDV